eukprot:GFUD01013256.1.p1 GENE.GFUD01013256.1~~GFUD01013256.1.p1  ORF type:complete len:744 (-),score=268.89 GFUD01013256.1:271-2502(-)
MAGKRTRRASQSFQPTKISEDEFTSGDKFVFTIDSPSPKGRVTRSRRSSICLNPPTKTTLKARRQTMLPAVKEMPKSPVNKPVKAKVVEQLLKTPSKGIGATNFYASPAKIETSKPSTSNQMSPIKSVAVVSSISPTKKFSKSANKTLTEMDILENLDLDEEFDNKTPVDAKKPPKTFKTEIPAEKTKNQRTTVEIKSPIVVAKSGKKSKIPVKSPPTKAAIEKVKSSVKAGRISKSPLKKVSKSPEIAKPALIKTPKKKIGKISLKDLPPGSPILDTLFKDIKKVEIRLTPLKIKEDPNVIFDLLEENYNSKFRVQKVVEAIVQMKKEASPSTRQNDSVTEVTPVEKAVKSTKKSSGKTKAAPKSVKKADASPKLKTREIKISAKDDKLVKENKSEEIAPKAAKEAKKAVVKGAKVTKEIKTSKTAVKETKTAAKETKTAAKKTKTVEKEVKKPKAAAKVTKSSKRALETKATPVQNKRIKLEIMTPKAFEIHDVAKKDTKTKTPKTTKKQPKTPKAAVKVEPITPVTPVAPEGPKSASKTPASAQKSVTKKTPKLVSQYKQKTPLGSLKKPLKRLASAKSTPAQVKPSDLLKKNLRKQVETAITAKMGSKPTSSPYTLTTDGNTENSPVFSKVESVTSKVVKSHITGTPARTKPTRKFGTVIQPASLLEDSVVPTMDTVDHKTVSSSTPVKPVRTGAEYSTEPHPLESVEATPIRPPCSPEARSPPPQMVTGKLANMCSIM